MPAWRPEGYQKILEEKLSRLKVDQSYSDAGADAMLEGIRRQPELNPKGHSIIYGGLTGKWLFIPDDENNQDERRSICQDLE